MFPRFTNQLLSSDRRPSQLVQGGPSLATKHGPRPFSSSVMEEALLYGEIAVASHSTQRKKGGLPSQ